jgi:hypothetical protein
VGAGGSTSALAPSVGLPYCPRRSLPPQLSSSLARSWTILAALAIPCGTSTEGSILPDGGADWRIRYKIDEDTHTVIVLDISHRSDAYGT